MLFASGDPVRSLFVIEIRRLRLLRHTAHGAVLVLHVAQAGEAYAEASLFWPTYHRDAVAEIASTVIDYPKRPSHSPKGTSPGETSSSGKKKPPRRGL